MKNNKFLATVLAAQVGMCGVVSPVAFTAKPEVVVYTDSERKKSESGIISTLASRTVDFAYDLASGVLKVGGGIALSLITGEFGIAVHNNISSEHHYTQRALFEAGINVSTKVYDKLINNGNAHDPFHVWCEEIYQIKPVKVVGFDYPGLYEYNGHYYILIGNYGVNLGTVKTEAVEACKNMWAKTKTVAGEAKDFCVNKAKKVYYAFKNDNTTSENNQSNNNEKEDEIEINKMEDTDNENEEIQDNNDEKKNNELEDV